MTRKRQLPSVAYLLLLPGMAWLAFFFVIPLVTLIQMSLQSGTFTTGYTLTWEFGNFATALGDYGAWFVRSFLYSGIATVLALVIGYPLAYTIALRSGRFKYVLVTLVVAPFFASFLVRTIAWSSILSDTGIVVSVLRGIGILGPTDHLLATPVAVVAGLTYNFLPFMVLPIFLSLDRFDIRMLDAAQDLYASSSRAFRRVTFPLSLPGVVAGTLLCFIPAAGDFINAQLLGNSSSLMVGNVIDSQFLRVLDYPMAAALSVILMILIIVPVSIYVRRTASEELM
ncbi:MAG: ABC transporter permease [Solirubrobacterales bacterium]|nr:ABC transporter permease [Solirubrobacterales bacterium]